MVQYMVHTVRSYAHVRAFACYGVRVCVCASICAMFDNHNQTEQQIKKKSTYPERSNLCE